MRVLITAGPDAPREARRFVASLADLLEQRLRQRGVGLVARERRGDAAEPRSITLRVHGDPATVLAADIGTHALLAASPARGKRSRKRWYAAVGLLDDLAAAQTLRPSDVRLSSCRARGPGGQNVNRRATAVRAEHGPSGLRVRAEEARSQAQNRRAALVRLAARLEARDAAARAALVAGERARHRALTRGCAVRTYRLGRDGALVPFAVGDPGGPDAA